MTPPPPHPALLARRARVRRIRARVAAGTTALFLAAFSGLYVQMATGHDPVLGTSTAQVASATTSSSSTSSSTSSTSSTSTRDSEPMTTAAS